MKDFEGKAKAMEKVRKLARMIHPAHNLEGHILPVVAMSVELAKELNADVEIAEMGALLHDAGRVRFGCYKHEITGAHYCRIKLWQYGFPKAEAARIIECVRCHRSGADSKPSSIEARIVANADALSHFECALYLFSIRYSSTKNLKDTIGWLRDKLSRDLRHKLTLKPSRERAIQSYRLYIKPLLNKADLYCRQEI